MAKKIKKIKLTKDDKKFIEKDDSCACTAFLIILGLIALSGVIYYFLTQPKFEEGECLLNRAYEFKQVYIVDEDTYTLRSMKVDNFPFGVDYALETDYSAVYQEKSISWADEHYTKVPCESH